MICQNAHQPIPSTLIKQKHVLLTPPGPLQRFRKGGVSLSSQVCIDTGCITYRSLRYHLVSLTSPTKLSLLVNLTGSALPKSANWTQPCQLEFPCTFLLHPMMVWHERNSNMSRLEH